MIDTTTVRLPDGSEVEIATDDPKQAAAAAQKIWARRQAASAPKPKAPPAPLNTTRAAIGNAIDNVLPIWGDEVAGAGRWLGAHLGSGRDPKTAFAEGQREFKEEQARYKQEHPVLSTATALGGLGLGMAAPVGRLASGAGMGIRMAHGAAVGAGYGAVSGAGEGNGMAERGANALRSGAIGAGLGAAATPLINGGVALARRAQRVVPGAAEAVRHLGNVPRAVMRRPLITAGQRAEEHGDRMLAQTMGSGNIDHGMGQPGPASSPQAIGEEVARRRDMDVDAMPADVTEGMRQTTAWAARGTGPGQTMVQNALKTRKMQDAARVRHHVTETMGPAVDPVLGVEQMVQSAKDAAAPGYRAAYAQPMVVTPEITGIMQTPAFRDALPVAIRNIRNAQRDPQALGFQLDEDGAIRGINTLSTEGFDQVLRAMKQNREGGMRPPTVPGGRPTDTTDTVHIGNLARGLQSGIGEHNEAFRDVTQRYADDMTQKDAFFQGGTVADLTGHEVAAQRRRFPEGVHEAWTAGARTALADQASTYGAKYPTADVAGAVRKSLGDATKQDAIGQMGGNTGAIRDLGERLEAEGQSHLTYQGVNGNSRTAHNQALDSSLDEAVGGRVSSLTGRGMLLSVIDHIAARGTAQFRNDVKARIARVVTETNPQTVAELMQAIADRAQRDREFASLLHRSGVLTAKAAGANIEPVENADDE